MASKQFNGNRSYLAVVAVARKLHQLGMIGEGDYSALEEKAAENFSPLFRYEKPCLLPTLPITQTGRRAEK